MVTVSSIEQHPWAIFGVFLVVGTVIRPMLTVLFVTERVPGSTAGVLLVGHLVAWSLPEMFFAGLVHGTGNPRHFLVPVFSIQSMTPFL